MSLLIVAKGPSTLPLRPELYPKLYSSAHAESFYMYVDINCFGAMIQEKRKGLKTFILEYIVYVQTVFLFWLLPTPCRS
jgi:hypothetical protein